MLPSANTGVISVPQYHPDMKAESQNRVAPDDQIITCCAENNMIILSLLPLCSHVLNSGVDLKLHKRTYNVVFSKHPEGRHAEAESCFNSPFQEIQLSGFAVINVLNVDKYQRFVLVNESSFPEAVEETNNVTFHYP